ncbi:MAG TPA: acyl carrier protein [Rhizomicrobium sp.]|nr:acyl carrier protein [Rhizomicrobium sp.]
MDKSVILDTLTDVFRKVLDDPAITLTPETTAEDVENWDSLNHVFIVVEVEQRFGIKFQAAEMEELKNVGELVDLIERRLAKS